MMNYLGNGGGGGQFFGLGLASIPKIIDAEPKNTTTDNSSTSNGSTSSKFVKE